ncbi:MAG TPA: alpha/beta fold hydrolase [Egibacteraceae bacterium]|nr:alpha/beta fold hydrolase [Egibacteraceae bacterium]
MTGRGRYGLQEGVALLQRQASSVLRGLLRPATYVGTGLEMLHAAVHATAYPLGMFSVETMQDVLGAEQAVTAVGEAPDPAVARAPIILVHGYVMNRSAFFALRQGLRTAGFQHVRAFNYPQFTHPLEALAAMLATEVTRALAASGQPKCMIVGHSMGGIVARYYLQELGGEEWVDTVVTLGTPHAGTYTSHLGVGPAAAQMTYRSPFLERLRAGARPSAVRYISYYSDLDAWVLPASSAKLTHPALQASNVRVRDIGHLSMLVSAPVIRSVVEYLSRPDLDRPQWPGLSVARPPASQQAS